jgi:virulence-associated protein VapD
MEERAMSISSSQNKKENSPPSENLVILIVLYMRMLNVNGNCHFQKKKYNTTTNVKEIREKCYFDLLATCVRSVKMFNVNSE